VYQAMDSKLGRRVALKVLPETFTHDAERVARLEREARMLAALNHPNIAFIFGLERAGERNFLVMELVDGETLAERIKRGPVPFTEALPISRQILEALEGAHERGVIHRDLKPANIKITSDGKVKVLDFGLAKSMSGELPSESASTVMSNSPTLSAAATQAGMILGTAAYMSPEQAKGKSVDRRTDIFAFGCILYEMLTGKPAFDGEDVTEILGAVVRLEPDWSALPANTPLRMRELLRFCLEKNAKNRRGTATDVRLDIEAVSKESTGQPTASASAAQRGKPLVAWGVTAVLLIAVVVLSIPYFRSTPAPALTRFKVSAPSGTLFTQGAGFFMEISPDGKHVAFLAAQPGKDTQLFIRSMDATEARAISGNVSTSRPFWSPDSRFVAFLADGQLKKVEVNGGSAQNLTTFSGSNRGSLVGAWGSDVILFTAPGTNGLLRLSPQGGTPTQFTTLDNGELYHQAFSFLPDGKHFLLGIRGPNAEASGVYAASVDSKERKKVVSSSYKAEFAAPDQLLFVRDGSLFTQTINTRTFSLEGEATRVAENIATFDVGGYAGYSVSQNGVLVVSNVNPPDADGELSWYDRKSNTWSPVGTASFRGIDLSPDGKRLAAHYHRVGAPGGDLVITDLERNTTTRFTFDESQDNSSPIWSPNGDSIAYSSLRNGRFGIYRKASNGVGSEELLFESATPKVPTSWSRDGNTIVFVDYVKSSGDIWILPLTGDKKPIAYLQSPLQEAQAQLSPDGHWLAYLSGGQVWVQSFPAPGTKWQVSPSGGGLPRWRSDGKELFFSGSPNAEIWSVSVSANGAGLVFSAPKLVFGGRFYTAVHTPNITNYHTYAVSADGNRFLIPRPQQMMDSEDPTSLLTVVLNWTSLLKK